MAKTYTAAGSATAGDVYTASAHNVIITNVNNFIVPPALRLERASGTNFFANNTDTFVTWPTEVFDTDGCYTATSDTITIQTAGIYQVSAGIYYDTNSTGNRVVAIAKNPTSASDVAARFASAAVQANTYTGVNCSGLISLAVNDVIKVIGFQSSGGALSVWSTATTATFVSAVWVGRTS